MTSTGCPCTSCSFYDIPCSIPIDRRGKSAKPKNDDPREAERLLDSVTASHGPNFHDSAEDSGERCDSNLANDQDRLDVTDWKAQHWMKKEKKSLKACDDAISSSKRPVNWYMLLPGYASPLSPSITRKDSQILKKGGAFDVPNAKVRDELLRSYVQYLHPALPVLSLEDFLMVIDDSYTGSNGVSFLLFQAVAFAATAFESPESLAIDGFRNRREARKTRFERAKMLYIFGCEEDRVTILQTILLLTYWDDTSADGTHDAWHFVREAKAILRSIQLKPTDSEIELFQQRPGLWRRIYWSLYMRDRLVAIAMRRPVQLGENEFEVDMLKPSDLYIGPLSTKCCLGSDGGHPAIRDPSVRSLLSQITILLVHCCRCIGRVLSCRYTSSRIQNGLNSSSLESLVPRSPPPTGAEVLLRDSELEEWHRSLPEALCWSSSSPLHHISKHGHVILLFRAMLNGLYGLTSIALHRPHISRPVSWHSKMAELSKRRVHDSATTIARIYDFCILKDSAPLFSDSQVAILESSIVTHLGDLQSSRSSTQQSAIDHFQTCARALQHLSNTYPSADVTLTFVDAAVRNTETGSLRATTSIEMDSCNDKPDKMHGKFIETTSGDETLDRGSEPTISQQLDSLQLSQTSELLCSHFMMTSFEKDLLQDLLSSGEESYATMDDSDSSAWQDSQSPLEIPSTQVSTLPASLSLGSPPAHNVEETEDPLSWDFEVDELVSQPLLVGGGFESQFKDKNQPFDDSSFFQMMSQYCME